MSLCPLTFNDTRLSRVKRPVARIRREVMEVFMWPLARSVSLAANIPVIVQEKLDTTASTSIHSSVSTCHVTKLQNELDGFS